MNLIEFFFSSLYFISISNNFSLVHFKIDELSTIKNQTAHSPQKHQSGSSNPSPSTQVHHTIHSNAITRDYVHGITTLQKHSHNPLIISHQHQHQHQLQQPPSPLSCRVPVSAQVQMANSSFHCNSIARTLPRGSTTSDHHNNKTTATVNVINSGDSNTTSPYGQLQRHPVTHEMRV